MRPWKISHKKRISANGINERDNSRGKIPTKVCVKSIKIEHNSRNDELCGRRAVSLCMENGNNKKKEGYLSSKITQGPKWLNGG